MIGNRYEYDIMAACEKDLWWYKCLHELTLKTLLDNNISLSASMLDAGCGTGGLLLFLQKNNFTNLSGLDYSLDAVEYATEKTKLSIQQQDLTNIANAYQQQSFDVVISNDTFCLFESPNDKKALNDLWAFVKPGGLMIFNIAALKAFRGTHDVSVEMKKRYTKSDIKAMLPPTVSKTTMLYWPFLLSPLIFFFRFMQRLQLIVQPNKKYKSDISLPSPFINNLFYTLTKWENRHIKWKPWGSSVFVVMYKKK